MNVIPILKYHLGGHGGKALIILNLEIWREWPALCPFRLYPWYILDTVGQRDVLTW
jgi:hypothetical protein